MIFDTTVPSQHYRYQKKHFAMFDYFVKTKLVSTVQHINSTIKTWLLAGQRGDETAAYLHGELNDTHRNVGASYITLGF